MYLRTLTITAEECTGRSNLILHRKLKYYISCLIDGILKKRKSSLKRHIKYFNFRNKIQLDHSLVALNIEPLVVGRGEDVSVLWDRDGRAAAAVAEAEPRVEAERVHLREECFEIRLKLQ